LVEALRTVAEHHDDKDAPFVADPRQHRGDPAAVTVEVRLGRQDRHFFVLGSHGCARVSKTWVLSGFWDSHSYSVSYKFIPQRDDCHETASYRLQRARPPLRQPKS